MKTILEILQAKVDAYAERFGEDKEEFREWVADIIFTDFKEVYCDETGNWENEDD